jgi:hypothetical protein
MKTMWMIIVSGLILCLVSPASWTAGTSKYGHPADCDCSSLGYFCGDEYVELGSTHQNGDEYVGEPKYLTGVVKCCEDAAPGTCKFELATQTQTVSAGSWGGYYEVALNASLPPLFSVHIGGGVWFSGSATVQVNIQAKVECSNSTDCVAHSGEVGPGYTDQTVTTNFHHYCWGSVDSGCTHPWVTCGHHLNQQGQSVVTYLSSQILEDVICNRELTEGEKAQCGPCQCDD